MEHPTDSIEPESGSSLTEFVDQFSDDTVFGVLEDPDGGTEGFWVVRDIEKVRPAAVPIDQPTTFEMNTLGPDGTIVGELRLHIKESEQVRVADCSFEHCPNNDVE